MAVIELSDEQAAALQAKAAAAGLTLEAWLQKLAAGAESERSAATSSAGCRGHCPWPYEQSFP